MKKIFLAILILISVFCVAGSTLALTESERLALIAQIQAQIDLLIQQLNQMIANQQGTNSWCHTFNINMNKGDTGTEVLALQLALQKEGFNISASEIQNGQYGDYVTQAVIAFQEKYASEILYPLGLTKGTGKVASATRKKLNQLYSCDNNINPCVTLWQCTPWGTCLNNSQTRSCYDANYCGVTSDAPSLTQSCISTPACTEANWAFTLSPTVCPLSGTQTKTWGVFGTCSGGVNHSITETVSCNNQVSTCTPNWSCSNFSNCINDQKIRTCTDSNNCGTSTNRPALTQGCNSAPTVDIEINNSDGLVLVSNNKPVILKWTATDATSCTATGGWSGSKEVSGLVSTSNITSSTTFTITCTGAGGTTSDSVTANPSTSVSVDLKIDDSNGPISTSNNIFTLSWSSANTSSCTASGAWSGTRATFGSETIMVPITSISVGGSSTYTITCMGAGGIVLDKVDINWTSTLSTVELDINGQKDSVVNFTDSFVPNHFFVLNWSAANTVSCTISTTCAQSSTISGYSIPVNYCQQDILDSSSDLSGTVPAVDSKLVNIDLSSQLYASAGLVTPWSYKMILSKTYKLFCISSGGSAISKQITAKMTFNGSLPYIRCKEDSDCGAPTTGCVYQQAGLPYQFQLQTPRCSNSDSIYAQCYTQTTQGNGTCDTIGYPSCTPDWRCDNWSVCTNNQQTRTCNDLKYCNVSTGKPAITQSCNSSLPVIDIKANGADGTLTLESGTAVSLSWTATNASLCTASGSWSGTKAMSNTESMGALTSSKTYTITCTKAGVTAVDSVIVVITKPVISIEINGASNAVLSPGESAIITWSAVNAVSCTASGDWSGALAISGTRSMGPVTLLKTYIITCTDNAGNSTTSRATANVR